MGSQATRPEREYVETGLEPEFNVNHITHEHSEGGLVRIFCWKLIHAKFVLQYTAVVSGPALVQMGRQCMTAGADAHNLEQWRGDLTEH